jgi:uncharacterized protein (DUF2147 family)
VYDAAVADRLLTARTRPSAFVQQVSMRLTRVAFLCLCLAALASLAFAQTSTPVGVWRLIDDKTGEDQGLVRIRENDGVLTGTIESTADPKNSAGVCEQCKDDRKDKPILGLPIIRGMRRDGDGWSGGDILDPGTGAVYRCSMRLEDDGRKLIVRGYIGISLLGRSQTWLRAE